VPLSPLQPTDTRPFFRPVAAELFALLRALPSDAWNAPTLAGTWRVRDVVAHLLDVGLRRVSFHRDGHTPPAPETPPSGDRDFVAFINGLNRQWVEAAARLSPRLLIELSAFVGISLADFVERFPDDGPALFPVSWAGEDESQGWFDLGREFTEQWHHQAQIREAVGAPPLSDPIWLHSVLLIALRGLPHAYRDTAADPGATVTIDIDGPGGGLWTLRRDAERWTLWAGSEATESARVRLSDDTAWRLLFNALPPERLADRITVTGEMRLAEPLARARSVVV
jgi:uncharacterized protein (TIGR03083 family)